MIDLVAFRCQFPEFSDETDYTDSMLNLWGVVAENLVDIERWGAVRPTALGWVLAHFVAIAKLNQQQGDAGSVPGANTGAMTQKKVGEVQVQYDPATFSESGAGQWNRTVYGTEYLALVRVFGVGVVQL